MSKQNTVTISTEIFWLWCVLVIKGFQSGDLRLCSCGKNRTIRDNGIQFPVNKTVFLPLKPGLDGAGQSVLGVDLVVPHEEQNPQKPLLLLML